MHWCAASTAHTDIERIERARARESERIINLIVECKCGWIKMKWSICEFGILLGKLLSWPASHYTMRLWLVWIVQISVTREMVSRSNRERERARHARTVADREKINRWTNIVFCVPEHGLNAYVKPKQTRCHMLKCIMRFCIRIVLPHQLCSKWMWIGKRFRYCGCLLMIFTRTAFSSMLGLGHFFAPSTGQFIIEI